MSEVIKLFLGANQFGADFPELELLRKIALGEGYADFRHWVEVEERNINYDGNLVVLRGAYTSICVARVANMALKKEVAKVLVDLPNCRDDVGRIGTRGDFLLGLDGKYRKDSRISFIESN